MLAAVVMPAAAADAVIHWNEKAVETIAAAATPAPLASRNMAVVQVAVFEAVNAVKPSYRSYLSGVAPLPGASRDVAVAFAAHGALLRLYPERRPALDAALQDAVRGIDGEALDAGRRLGERAAAAVLELRRDDGIAPAGSYTLPAGPALWVPPSGVAALAPHWGAVKPWVMAAGSQFRPSAPPAADSERQLRDLDEVQAVGGTHGSARTPEQTDIARLWITPGVPIWNPIARQLAAAARLSSEQNARLFALLAMASADAIIACWDAKYAYHGWRPVQAIRSGGVPGRTADPAWEPAVPTPPFPGYVSGHACFGGAAQVVLESVFGRGEVPRVTLTTASAPGVARHYTSISSIVEEASNARIWGGVHWRTDQTVGEELGRTIGRLVVDTQLRPLD
jgi:hypothetical protein